MSIRKQRRPDLLEDAIYVALYVIVFVLAAAVVAAAGWVVVNAPTQWRGAVLVSNAAVAVVAATLARRGSEAEVRGAVTRTISATGEAWVQAGIAQDAEKRLRDSGQTPVVEDIGDGDIERVEGARAVNAGPTQLGIYDWSADLGDEAVGA